MKKCRLCGIDKELSEFNKNKLNKDGLETFCRECSKERSKLWRKSEKHKDYVEKNKKNFSDYQKDYRKNNKEQIKAQRDSYYENNQEYIKERDRKNYNKTKDHINAKRRERRKDPKIREKYKIEQRVQSLKNPETGRRAKRKYKRVHKEEITRRESERKTSDPVYKFSHRIRNAIKESISRKGFCKRGLLTRDIVGMDFEDFLVHLVYTAVKNYGFFTKAEDYHIDHKKPMASAKTEEDAVKLNHFSNLQYLTVEDNLKKSSSLTYHIPYPPVSFPISNELEYEQYTKELTIFQ